MMKISAKLLTCLAALSLLITNSSIGTNCYGLFYQPRFPEKLQK